MSYFIFTYTELVDGVQTGSGQIGVHSSDKNNHQQNVKDNLKGSLKQKNPNAKSIEIVFVSIKEVSREQYLSNNSNLTF